MLALARTTSRATLLRLLLGASILLTVGCGGESEEDKVRDAVEEFASAGQERDFETACGLLTEEARAQVGGERCAQLLERLAGQGAVGAEVEVSEVRVNGETAEADAEVDSDSREPITQSLTLQKVGDEWRIANFGG